MRLKKVLLLLVFCFDLAIANNIDVPPRAYISINTDTSKTVYPLLLNKAEVLSNYEAHNLDYTVEIKKGPKHGTIKISSFGNAFIYTPSPGFNGKDIIEYQLVANTGLRSNFAKIVFTVHNTDESTFVLLDKVLATNEDTELDFNLSEHISNYDDVDPASIYIVNSSNGQAILDEKYGSILFIPASNFNGFTSFSYRVTTKNGIKSNIAKINIEVKKVNDAPTSSHLSFQAISEIKTGFLSPQTIDIDDNYHNVTEIASKPSNGEITLSNGKISYVSNKGFIGTDTFTYVVSDKAGLKTTGRASVEIIPRINASIVKREIKNNPPKDKIVFKGPSKQVFDLKFNVPDHWSQLKDVEWYTKIEGETIWKREKYAGTTLRKFFEVGRYKVKAILNDRWDESLTTKHVAIISYKQPELIVTGPKEAWPGSTVELSAKIKSVFGDISLDDISWGVVGQPQANKKGGNIDFTVPYNTKKEITYYASFLSDDFIGKGQQIFLKRLHKINVIKPKPAALNIFGPSDISTNRTYIYRIDINPPWGDSFPPENLKIESYWIDPLGKKVKGDKEFYYKPLGAHELNKDNKIVITYKHIIRGRNLPGGKLVSVAKFESNLN